MICTYAPLLPSKYTPFHTFTNISLLNNHSPQQHFLHLQSLPLPLELHFKPEQHHSDQYAAQQLSRSRHPRIHHPPHRRQPSQHKLHRRIFFPSNLYPPNLDESAKPNPNACYEHSRDFYADQPTSTAYSHFSGKWGV
jgi:hypothetical protein